MPNSKPPQKKRENSGRFGHGKDPSVGKATQIQPGEVRNPGGRPKTKPITERLLKLMEQPFPRDKSITWGDKVAEIILKLVEDENVPMVKELLDRVDGKSVQPVSGPDGGPIPITAEGIDEYIARILQSGEDRASAALPDGRGKAESGKVARRQKDSAAS